MVSSVKKRILVAPLDWGLGHTTRCVPVIRHILSLGHDVLFAGNEWQRRYIEESFGTLASVALEGYNVQYNKGASGFLFSILYQAPRLVRRIRKEHDWLLELATGQQIHGIISDNRYGLFHPKIPAVIITHQLLVQTGIGNTTDNVLRQLHYKYLNRFDECWVADVPGFPNLSGRLAHPDVLPDHAKYIGLLSQMAVTPEPAPDTGKHLLVLLSGPEPQRSILSHLLWKQVIHSDVPVVFVEGSNDVQEPAEIPQHIAYYRQVTKETLLPLLQQARYVICRSGYSTLMDLAALRKKAILIPTPGQTEQEYLGRYLHEQDVFYSMPQRNFDLARALKEATTFPFKRPEMPSAHQLFRKAVEDWVNRI